MHGQVSIQDHAGIRARRAGTCQQRKVIPENGRGRHFDLAKVIREANGDVAEAGPCRIGDDQFRDGHVRIAAVPATAKTQLQLIPLHDNLGVIAELRQIP